jgi:ATP-binding cassette subfamily F protein uup
LQSFKGCLLIVSHDRYFLDKTVDHLFIFKDNGAVKDFVGQYSEYREYMREVEAEQTAKAKTATPKSEPATTRQRTATRKLSYKEQRELEELERILPELEGRKAEIEQQLSSGTLPHNTLMQLSAEVATIIEQIEQKEMRWLGLSEI